MKCWPLLLCLPLLPGCFGFCYPAVSSTPPVSAADGDVRAFRAVGEVTLSGPLITGPITFSGETEEIPITGAVVESQQDAYLAYYYLIFPFQGDHSRSMRVLLYRPGYQTVEVPERPWWRFAARELPQRVVWKEAPDLAAQEEAVRKIVSNNRLPHNRRVLEFAAGEYARLAATPAAQAPEMAATRASLLTEAAQCQDQLRHLDTKWSSGR